MKVALSLALLLPCLLVAGEARSQGASKPTPVEVKKARGDFAKALQGVLPPEGKGWKPVLDSGKRMRLMLPEGWKWDLSRDGETILRAQPPSGTAVLLVTFTEPGPADPLRVDEKFAEHYAAEVADDPLLKKRKFQPTDSGYVLNQGLRFALAGGTMVGPGGKLYRQQQLVYVGDDRILTVQFTCPESEFARYAADLARIFASYQDVGVRRIE